MEDPLAAPPQLDKQPPTLERHSVRQKAGKSRIKRTIIILGALIALLGIGYEAFRVLTKKSKPAPVSPPTVQESVQTSQAIPNDVPDAGSTKQFSSTQLNLKFSYPDTWKVTETADQGIRIESPEFSYITNDEGQVDGHFRVYIRRGARAADSKVIGRGYADAPSEKLAYTNPSTDQRKETLLTRFGLDEPTNFAYFFIAGNFQLNKGDTLGPNYGKESETYIIAGGYTNSKKTDDMDFFSVATEMPLTSNAYKQAVQIIASLQL